MALIDLWKGDRSQILEKRLQQLIAFAGEGRLRDGNDTSDEFRTLLRVVPSDLLAHWVDEILAERFEGSGLALQDIVNEIGRRLGFEVAYGLYRGKAGALNQDGFWRLGPQQGIVVESKSSTTYEVDIAKIAGYRGKLSGKHSSRWSSYPYY